MDCHRENGRRGSRVVVWQLSHVKQDGTSEVLESVRLGGRRDAEAFDGKHLPPRLCGRDELLSHGDVTPSLDQLIAGTPLGFDSVESLLSISELVRPGRYGRRINVFAGSDALFGVVEGPRCSAGMPGMSRRDGHEREAHHQRRQEGASRSHRPTFTH